MLTKCSQGTLECMCTYIVRVPLTSVAAAICMDPAHALLPYIVDNCGHHDISVSHLSPEAVLFVPHLDTAMMCLRLTTKPPLVLILR